MELVLVRHGLPFREVRDGEPADPGLAPTGVEQALAVAGWLAAERTDAIAQSPSRRAVDTAAPLARHLGLRPDTHEGLAEFDHGSSSYVPVEEMRRTGDPRYTALMEGRLYGSGAVPGVFLARVLGAVDDIIARHPGQRVAVFCHGGVINAYVGHVLGIARPLWFSPRYGSISRVLAARSGKRSVLSLNEVPRGYAGLREISVTDPAGGAGR